jgi:cob(I)alamin adenosyltransferase
MTKIYTRGGDAGQTSTANGIRLSKCDNLCHAQGDIDELNCQLGLIQASMKKEKTLTEISTKLFGIQHRLFNLGTLISLGAKPTPTSFPTLTEKDSHILEKDIDEWTEALPPLTHFILPGGSLIVSQLHIARAICRRAERQLAALPEIKPCLRAFVNRLSDWLFTLARYVADLTQTPEIKWDKEYAS